MSDKNFLDMVAANWPYTREWMTPEDLQAERQRIRDIANRLTPAGPTPEDIFHAGYEAALRHTNGTRPMDLTAQKAWSQYQRVQQALE
jgi:hypothetical protein